MAHILGVSGQYMYTFEMRPQYQRLALVGGEYYVHKIQPSHQ